MNHFPKLIFALVLSSFLLFSCKEELPSPNCIDFEMHATWPQEEFKDMYNIQFPSSYTGSGRIVHFEGEYFEKSSSSDDITFASFYCDGLFCPEFGAEKPAGTITGSNSQGDPVVLDQRKDYCKNGQIAGQFYYDLALNSTGKLYLMLDSTSREAMDVQFPQASLVEVTTILSTIIDN